MFILFYGFAKMALKQDNTLIIICYYWDCVIYDLLNYGSFDINLPIISCAFYLKEDCST